MIKHRIINALSTSVNPVVALLPTEQPEQDTERYQDQCNQLRSLQLELMANPSADLMSKFVEVIFEVLLGPKQIQLKPSITSRNSSSGYSILQLDTAFVLWLINGEEEIVRSETDETATTPFLGLKGLGKLGLKTNQIPDASVRFKEWGKLTFSEFLRGENFDLVEKASGFTQILEEDYHQSFYDFRCQLKTKVQEHANLIFEGLFEQFYVSVLKNLDDLVDPNLVCAKKILPQFRAGDFDVIDTRLKRLTELEDKSLTISKDKLKKLESGLVKGKDLLTQMRELMKKRLEMQAQGLKILTKALSFLKPAVEMLRKIMAIVTDLANGKFPAVRNVAASIAMAKLSSLNTLSREFEEQAQKKLDKFNPAGAMLDTKSRNEILDLIDKEIRGEIVPSAQDSPAGNADSAAQQQPSTLETSQILLRRLFRLLENAADGTVSEADSTVEGAVTEAVGKLLPDETMLVLNSTVDSMVAVQSVLEQKIFELKRLKSGVGKAEAVLYSEILQPIGSILSDIRGHVSNDDDSIKVCIVGVPLAVTCTEAVLAAFRMCNTLRSQGESLLSTCEKSGQIIGMMQFKPVKLSGASESKLNGVYFPTILQHGGKPEFRQSGAEGGFVLLYKDKQGWCVCEDSEGAPVLESNSHVEMPHLMVDAIFCMTEGPAGDKLSNIKIEAAQSSLSDLNMGQMTEKMKTKLRDAADGVQSAAQDMLAHAYEECESAFNNAKEELVDTLDLEIQMELPDLLSQFKPLENVLMQAGGAIFQNQNKLAQRERYRVRAASFFALAQLQACLVSARTAQNKGIIEKSHLDLEAALKAVDALIVRMSSLETDRRLKRFFKTASFAGEVWKHRNTGWRDLDAEQSGCVDEIGSLIEEIARETDPQKKKQMAKKLQSEQKKLEKNAKGLKVVVKMLINQAHTAANNKISATSAVSKGAWDDEKQQIESELRSNLADLKNKQEKIEASDSEAAARQVLMMQVREEQLAIMTQLSNVQAVGLDLGVSVPFLQGLSAQLDTINNKLDELAAAVKETADNVRMLVGRPVMEVLETHRTDLIVRRRKTLPDSVYIPTECLEVGVPGILSGKFFGDKDEKKPLYQWTGVSTYGYLHPFEEGLYVFAVNDDKTGDTIMVGARSATFKAADDEKGTMSSSSSNGVATGKTGTMSGDLYRVAKGLDLENITAAAVIEAYDKAADVEEKNDEKGGGNDEKKEKNDNKKRSNFSVAGVPAPRAKLMDKVKEFLANEPTSELKCAEYGPLSKKGVMLIHGPAGSGKTRFSRELELRILDEYYNERKKQGITVLLIKCQLQILQRPLTDLFFETMRRQYRLREVQIHALYDKILDENEKIECVFLLDGYDEMRPEFHKHNLFSSNNLENFRNGGNTSTTLNYPKVIYLSRSEIFTGRTSYDKVFLPIEAENVEKDDEHEARDFFYELRIASFDSRMNTYLSQYCALALRQKFERQCGSFRPTAPSYMQTLNNIVEKTLGSTTDDETTDAIHAMAKTLTSSGELDVLTGHPAPENTEGDDSLDRAKTQMIRMVGMLDDFRVACHGQGHAGMPTMNETQRRDLAEDALEDHVWTQRMFVERIESITGLKELTRTPFLATIVADIMHVLHEMSSSPGEVKQEMILLLGDEAESERMVERSWALLRKDRSGSIGLKWESVDPISLFRGELGALQIDLKEQAVAFSRFVTMRSAQRCPLGGKGYYELEILELDIKCQYGFAAPAFARVLGYSSKGVGDDSHSWSVDGARLCKWHNGKETYPCTFKEGDVIGLACDLNTMQMHVSVNGSFAAPNGIVFEFAPDAVRDGLFAAFSGKKGKVRYNLGEAPFKHAPPAADYQGFVAFETSLPSIAQIGLAEALTRQTEFTQLELDGFKVGTLSYDSYIKVEDKYFRPAGSKHDYKDPICTTVESLCRTQTLLKQNSMPLLKLLNKIAEDVVVKLRTLKREDGKQGALNPEEKDKRHKLNKVMLRALREKRTRRYMIYKVFVEQLVSRQAAVKILGSSGMALSLDQLIAETWNYMQRFASYLVENGLSKVRYEPGTVLFAAQDNELGEFFDFADQANNRGEIRRLALNVSPITQEGDVFSFIHKSILEFLVAKQVRDGIMLGVRNTRMSLSSLTKILSCLEPVLQDGAKQMDAAELELKLKALADQDNLKELKKSSEQRRVAKLLIGLVREVAASSIARVDLEEEPAVRDFVIDCLLNDEEFCSAFGAIAVLCRLKRLHGGALSGLAFDNILHTCTSNNVKREGNNLFYVAVEQNNLFLLRTAIDILQGVQAIGLSWTDVGAEKPKTGTEITNSSLSTALAGKLQKPDFTHAELESLRELEEWKVHGALSCNSYIQVGNTYFKPRNAVLEQAWIHSAREGDADEKQMMVDAGADVNLLSTEHMTALMYAAKEGHTECVRVLMKVGSDPAKRDKVSPSFRVRQAVNGYWGKDFFVCVYPLSLSLSHFVRHTVGWWG